MTEELISLGMTTRSPSLKEEEEKKKWCRGLVNFLNQQEPTVPQPEFLNLFRRILQPSIFYFSVWFSCSTRSRRISMGGVLWEDNTSHLTAAGGSYFSVGMWVVVAQQCRAMRSAVLQICYHILFCLMPQTQVFVEVSAFYNSPTLLLYHIWCGKCWKGVS